MACDNEGGCVTVQKISRDVAVLDSEHREMRVAGLENRRNIGEVFRKLNAFEVSIGARLAKTEARISVIVSALVIVIDLTFKYLLPSK